MNWHRLAKNLMLRDGQIHEREADILKREILADHVVNKEEAEFLVELRRAASGVHPEFDRFFLAVLKKIVLTDGKVSDAEARWLRKVLFSHAPMTGLETRFLDELRREAKSSGEEFRRLCDEFLTAGRAKA